MNDYHESFPRYFLYQSFHHKVYHSSNMLFTSKNITKFMCYDVCASKTDNTKNTFGYQTSGRNLIDE
jgi:hypothetical protein